MKPAVVRCWAGSPMSSRGQMSTRRETARDELFGAASDPLGPATATGRGGGPTLPAGMDGADAGGGPPMRRGGGEDDEDGGLLELEHVIGYTGAHLATLVALPRLTSAFAKSMGSVVVIGDVGDPHAQEFLRGHDMELSALAVSASGALIASGQLGSSHRKGHHAPVIVWDGNTKRQAFVLHGHTLRVRSLAFSPDERFLCAAGDDALLYIWDMLTGEVIFGKKFGKPCSLFEWTAVAEKGRRRTYQCVIGCEGSAELDHGEISFDPTRQQWMLTSSPIVMPTAGMVRDYHCSAVSRPSDPDARGGSFLLAGTAVGDMVVFRLSDQYARAAAAANAGAPPPTGDQAAEKGGVYRASVPVCSGGLLSIIADDARGAIFCGGGDGVIRKLEGLDMRWQLVAEASVAGRVTSLSLVHGGAELLVGTDAGQTFRLLCDDMTVVPLTSAHTAPLACVAFGQTRPDVFATASSDGFVHVWDLSDYSAIASTQERGAGGARALCWIGDAAVVVGWGDSYLRCYDAATARRLWLIPNAHRGAITSVAAHVDPKLAFLVSAADDGSVRVWALATREMMLQFVEHQKPVSQVLVDCKTPNLIHSAGRDCAVFTYDLKKERRVVAHMVREGAFTGLAQRLDSENELVTCDCNGRVLFWDCDVPEPVLGLSVPARVQISCASVSPSGKFLALCGDYVILVLELIGSGAGGGGQQPQPVAQGYGHSNVVVALQWSPDERQIISVGEDCCICVWNFYGGAGPGGPSGPGPDSLDR